MKAICGKPAPAFWRPVNQVCVLPKGHKITVRYTPKRRKRLVIDGHRTASGAWWPIGKANLEFE